MKQLLTGVIAIMLAFAGAAFTQPTKAGSNTLNNKYRYTLTTNAGMDNPANYEYTTSLSGCGTGSVVCIIDAPGPAGEGEHPSFEEETNPFDNEVGVTVYSQKQ